MFAPAPIDFRPLPPVGVGVALGLPAGVAAVLVTSLLGGNPVLGLLLAVAVAVAVGTRTAPVAATAAGAVCWACYDGFVVHRLGELGADPIDLVTLAVVTGAAFVGSMIVRRGYPGLPMPV